MQTPYPAGFRFEHARFLSWEKVEVAARSALVDLVGTFADDGEDVPDRAQWEEAFANAEVWVAKIAIFGPYGHVAAFRLPGEASDLFLLTSGPKSVWLTGRNIEIYGLTDSCELYFSEAAMAEYIRFFFHFVIGQMGRFIIAEPGASLRWRDDATTEIRGQLEDLLLPVTYRGLVCEGLHRFTTTIVFAPADSDTAALFRTDILIASENIASISDPLSDLDEMSAGQTALRNGILLLEQLPIEKHNPFGDFGDIHG